MISRINIYCKPTYFKRRVERHFSSKMKRKSRDWDLTLELSCHAGCPTVLLFYLFQVYFCTANTTKNKTFTNIYLYGNRYYSFHTLLSIIQLNSLTKLSQSVEHQGWDIKDCHPLYLNRTKVPKRNLRNQTMKMKGMYRQYFKKVTKMVRLKS